MKTAGVERHLCMLYTEIEKLSNSMLNINLCACVCETKRVGFSLLVCLFLLGCCCFFVVFWGGCFFGGAGLTRLNSKNQSNC